MAETIRHKLYNNNVVIDFYPTSHRYKLIEEDGKESGEWLKSPSTIVGKLDKSAPLMGWAVNMFYDRVIEEMRDGVNFTKDDVITMLNLGKGAYREKKETSANIGTVVHEYAQRHLEKAIKSVSDIEGFNDLSEEDQTKAINGQKAFDKWYKNLGGKSIESEFLVYSKKEKFVGTCDNLVKIGDDYEILDYKTSNGIYTSQIYQVTASMKAKEEENPDVKIKGARLVHLYKDDVYDLYGNLIKQAGDFGELKLTRSDLVKAYMVFKALKVVADNDLDIYKLINK